MKQDAVFYYPNRMGRIVLESMEEVVGKNGLNHVLNLMGRGDLIGNYPPFDSKMDVSFATISGLMTQLENAYGPRGGRGLSIRAGRVAFKYGIREFGQQIGLLETAFRLLPLNAKIRMGGQALAELFNNETDQRVTIKEGEGKLLWVIERCPLCWERHTEDAVCHLAVGLLQESLYWLSGGKIFNVEETLCIARGDPTCTIEIGQTPLT
jgi:predicted hydrocarbon binding protein